MDVRGARAEPTRRRQNAARLHLAAPSGRRAQHHAPGGSTRPHHARRTLTGGADREYMSGTSSAAICAPIRTVRRDQRAQLPAAEALICSQVRY
jgi:hypothetical protein